ncbi:hypothetical protein ACFQ0B_55165 [Nonomuraea thailandensis]
MIRMLLRVLGDEYARAMRRTVILMTITAVAEGLSYALLVPVLRPLLGGTPADAVPWLVAFGAAVALYAVLRYISDLSGMRVGTTMLRGMYRRLGEHLARLPSAGTTPLVSARCPPWPAAASCKPWAWPRICWHRSSPPWSRR